MNGMQEDIKLKLASGRSKLSSKKNIMFVMLLLNKLKLEELGLMLKFNH